jgi:hypothetical protein
MPDEAWWEGSTESSDDGERALGELFEIGQQRRALDDAELNAVRAARRARRSWAEIATKLGITRQSAWEKWRDLDDEPDDGLGPVLRDAADAVVRRVRGSGVVPDVVGMSFDDAREAVMRARLVPVDAQPDDAPLVPADWRSAIVVRQYPDAGTKLRAGSQVKLWVERGGGSAGVREPRRPVPPVREASAEVDIDIVVGE